MSEYHSLPLFNRAYYFRVWVQKTFFGTKHFFGTNIIFQKSFMTVSKRYKLHRLEHNYLFLYFFVKKNWKTTLFFLPNKILKISSFWKFSVNVRFAPRACHGEIKIYFWRDWFAHQCKYFFTTIVLNIMFDQ